MNFSLILFLIGILGFVLSRKNIFLFITIFLVQFSIFISFIFYLNPLIFIINGIILLNVIFVASYYLYLLLKNPIFWEIFMAFILSITFLITKAPEVLAETPEPEETYTQNLNLWSLQENFRGLQQELVAKRTDFEYKKGLFDIKVNNYSNYFNNFISHVEFKEGKAMPQFKYIDGQQNDTVEDNLIKIMKNHSKEIQEEAKVLLKGLEELEAMDKKVHSLAQTYFDNKEYQKLNLQLIKYRSGWWQGINHPNKILSDMDNRNRYF
jgi:hypothetical protein